MLPGTEGTRRGMSVERTFPDFDMMRLVPLLGGVQLTRRIWIEAGLEPTLLEYLAYLDGFGAPSP